MQQQYSTRRRRVYFAAPKPTYTTARYAVLFDRVGELFPKHELLSARDLFESNADWLARWPKVRRHVSVLVFITDEEGWIGYGVRLESLDVQQAGRPVFHLTDDGALVPLADVEFDRCQCGNWRRFAHVRIPVPATLGPQDARQLVGVL